VSGEGGPRLLAVDLGLKTGLAAYGADGRLLRYVLLHPSERRDGQAAKRNADRLARAVIEWSGAARPTSLRHDAAEAVCIGLWGVLEVGWLAGLPAELSTRSRGA
jgi:hypothetical protein